MTECFSVRCGSEYIGVELPCVVADLLALKLGQEPQSFGAKGVVREWLQEQLDEATDLGPPYWSEWFHTRASCFLAEEELMERYCEWRASPSQEREKWLAQGSSLERSGENPQNRGSD